MIRRPPRSTLDRSSAASDVYKRQPKNLSCALVVEAGELLEHFQWLTDDESRHLAPALSLIHISEPTRPY